MKKIQIISILASVCMLMTGCTLTTPIGTFTMSYNPDVKSEKVVFTDEQGKSQEVDVNDLNGQLDEMLNDVDLPQGTSTEDLKNFVNGTTDALGVQDTIDGLQDTLDSELNNGIESVEETTEDDSSN